MVMSFARFRCRRGAWRCTNLTTSLAHRLREPDGSVAETIFEKTADERHVVDDRCAGQGASFAQVLLVCLCTALSRGQSGR